MKISIAFKEFDRWIGCYVDRSSLPPTYYICPIPCICIKLELFKKGRLLENDGSNSDNEV